ncbi:hypothetical protein D3C80_1749890 [compost metagenome]
MRQWEEPESSDRRWSRLAAAADWPKPGCRSVQYLTRRSRQLSAQRLSQISAATRYYRRAVAIPEQTRWRRGHPARYAVSAATEPVFLVREYDAPRRELRLLVKGRSNRYSRDSELAQAG